jgi:hypothetical protein
MIRPFRSVVPELDPSIKWYADNDVRYRLDDMAEPGATP